MYIYYFFKTISFILFHILMYIYIIMLYMLYINEIVLYYASCIYTNENILYYLYYRFFVDRYMFNYIFNIFMYFMLN